MTIRLDDLVIPDFANEAEAAAWGKLQGTKDRCVLSEVAKAMRQIALNSQRSLTRRAQYAEAARLIRIAADAVPAKNTFVVAGHGTQGEPAAPFSIVGHETAAAAIRSEARP